MIIKTQNSTYEMEDKKIHSLSGASDRDTGISGEWRKFAFCTGVSVGVPLRIYWFDRTMTTTSNVASVEDDEPEMGWSV
ncbi:hypothetical protein LCGC14_0547260 [marine sediment metagenome]|uniref:Uncharacterized protein n=1 Tax=marine sediment metagenome TaxID=412755 RepID=A0A0F9RVR6_9ZZZZ